MQEVFSRQQEKTSHDGNLCYDAIEGRSKTLEDMKLLIERMGSKAAAAAKLEITVRYVDMILAGRYRPSKRLARLIRIYLA